MNLQDLLSDTFARKMIQEFGIEEESDETKAYLLARLAENISGRTLFELSKKISPEKSSEFDTLVAGDDVEALGSFLAPYVPDFAQFVQAEAKKEIERTKAYMSEELETSVTGGGE